MVAVLACLAGAAPAAEVLTFDNGIRARILDAADILAGDPSLEDAPGGPYKLQDDPENWYPFARDEVVSALAAMRGFHADIAVDIYILPAAPLERSRSWSIGNAIFLVPGFGSVAAQTVAYITTHEMGHVMTWACIDSRPGRWERYLEMRGLADLKDAPTGEHAWLPREILAEDLRYLFGGGLATISGSIENHELVTPDRVEGPRELLAGFLEDEAAVPVAARSRAYPNPCNPRTTIRMDLPVDAAGEVQAELSIYDVRGSLIRRLTGGRRGPGAVEIAWDGRDAMGGAAASGRYLYVMKARGFVARGAVTLVR